MVERQWGQPGKRDESRRCRVVGAAGFGGRSRGELEDHRDRRAPGVATGSGEDPEQTDHPGPEAGLLPDLPDDRRLQRLICLDEPARQRVTAAERRMATPDKEDGPPSEEDAVDREPGEACTKPSHAPGIDARS